MSAEAELCENLSESIKPMLAGVGPEIQGVVLADLTSLWLASFQGSDVEKLRELLLGGFIKQVRELTVVNEKMMLDRIALEKATQQ